jgi:uncharacterized protein DUF4124
MRWLMPAVLLALGFLLPFAVSGHAEIWQCTGKNGGLMFTDRPQIQSCEAYAGPSYSVGPSGTGKRKAVLHSTGFRGVRPAMTERQVLARAGYPNHRERVSCIDGASKSSCSMWVYNHGTKRVVELLLENGRVADIKNVPRP